ncbi:galactose-specific lectin nattectin-like [Biomphalaria glabrata]|uniref:Galactose-specific lectin nattectin-like n=1 Tax=Biomphalaria glabrata TaxID=6526 RepID=A0A9W2ZZD2_BIOGL|nr:galactose-specific lectin nattectin-like [Biomphalaria glabrata]
MFSWFAILTFSLCLGLNLVRAAQVTDVCPPQLARDQYLQVRNNICYQFVFYRKLTHSGAKAECERIGGSLVLVKDQDTQNYLSSQIAHYGHLLARVWIGLNDIVNENNFVWDDGTRPGYTNWAEHEGPGAGGDHDAHDCVVLDLTAGGKWRVFTCEKSSFLFITTDETHYYICQYQVHPVTNHVVIQIGDQATTQAPLVHVTSITHPCPILICNLDCGVNGFQTDPSTGCVICQCK